MKAIEYARYGPPEVLTLKDVGDPVVGDDDVLLRVCAVALNPLDWHFMRGTPYLLRLMLGLRRPKNQRLGVDLDLLRGYLEAGRIRTVIDRIQPLGEVASAIGYLEAGHARGKVVIRIQEGPLAG